MNKTAAKGYFQDDMITVLCFCVYDCFVLCMLRVKLSKNHPSLFMTKISPSFIIAFKINSLLDELLNHWLILASMMIFVMFFNMGISMEKVYTSQSKCVCQLSFISNKCVFQLWSYNHFIQDKLLLCFKNKRA